MQGSLFPTEEGRGQFPLVVSEQPQARFDRFGVHALSDTELLALVLNVGVRGQPVTAVASRLLAEAGSLQNLSRWTAPDFARLHGIGCTKAKQLAAMMEIARRMLVAAGEEPILNRPELVVEHLRPLAAHLEIEKFWVLCLNRKNRLIKRVELTSGTATSALAHPREVFREAIRYGSSAVICAHNHPSGDPAPSAADTQLTRQLREAARTIDIELIDHVILGRSSADPLCVGHYSFRTAGVL